jgi:hypothetical protein
MAFRELDPEIGHARTAYLELRGHLRGEAEFSPLDGVYNALKSPQRLLVGDAHASVDQQCESVDQMVTSLHRVHDLLATLRTRYTKRVGVGHEGVDFAISRLESAPGYRYVDHFTSAVKHHSHIGRGIAGTDVFIDSFAFDDRGDQVEEARRTASEIVDIARAIITDATAILKLMTHALRDASTFDPTYSEVCATPTADPSFYAVKPAEGSG